MKDIKGKIAYLQGLTQGLDLSAASKEGKVLTGIIDVLGDMANQLKDFEVAHTDLEEYVESIDEDLSDLEGDLFGDEAPGEEEMIMVECPKCHEPVYFEAGIVDDEDLIEVTCPNCDEVVYVNDQDVLNGTRDEEVIIGKKDLRKKGFGKKEDDI